MSKAFCFVTILSASQFRYQQPVHKMASLHVLDEMHVRSIHHCAQAVMDKDIANIILRWFQISLFYYIIQAL
jgi:hypothetical protein